MLWRRSYDVPPPPIEPATRVLPGRRPALRATCGADMPATECLADVVDAASCRTGTTGSVTRTCGPGKVVLLAAHGNSLRALVKHLDGISDEAIAGLNIPTGIPLLYELDDDFSPSPRAGSTWTRRRRRKPPPRSRTRAVDVTDPGTTHPPRAARGAVAPRRFRIALASDHAGYPLKEEIKAVLKGHDLTDFGTHGTEAADLPDYVHPAARAVSDGDVDRASSSTAWATAAR